MSKIQGGEIKRNDVLIYNGKLCKVSKLDHVKPGKGGAFAQVEMSDIKDGAKFNVRFRTDESVDKAFIETKNLIYSYKDGDMYVLMDEEGNELRLQEHELGVKSEFLQEGCQINGDFHEDNLVGLSWPSKSSVTMKVIETEQYLKGRTVTQKDKPATLENGVRVTVPCYIEVNQEIDVNPADGSFIQVAG